MTRGLDVLFVVPSLEPGGAERVVVNLANGLVALGARVRILMVDGRASSATALRDGITDVVTVHDLGRGRVRAAVPAIVRAIRRDPPTVVLATHVHVNLALCASRALLPRRTHLVVREPTHAPVEFDGRTTRWRRAAQRVLYRRADLVIATSEAMEQDLRRLTRARTIVLPNPVAEDVIRAAASTPPHRGATGRRFVSVGRLDSQKSLPELVAAFASAAGPADELVLVGEGPEAGAVGVAAERHGIADRVRLTGFLANPWAEVAAADAFLLASRAEGMPNAVLEALAVGTPVISTDELPGLDALLTTAPPGALTLVPRARLADAIRAAPRAPAPAVGRLRPSLLPASFRTEGATQRLRDALADLAGSGGRKVRR